MSRHLAQHGVVTIGDAAGLRFNFAVATLFLPRRGRMPYMMDGNFSRNMDPLELSSMCNSWLGHKYGTEESRGRESFLAEKYRFFFYKDDGSNEVDERDKSDRTAMLYSLYLSGGQRQKMFLNLCGENEAEEFRGFYSDHQSVLTADIMSEERRNLFRSELNLGESPVYEEGTDFWDIYEDLQVALQEKQPWWKLFVVDAKCRVFSGYHTLLHSPIDIANQEGYLKGQLSHSYFKESGLLEQKGLVDDRSVNLHDAYHEMLESPTAEINQTISAVAYVQSRPIGASISATQLLLYCRLASEEIVNQKQQSSHRSPYESVERFLMEFNAYMDDTDVLEDSNDHDGRLIPSNNNKVPKVRGDDLARLPFFESDVWLEYISNPSLAGMRVIARHLKRNKLGKEPPMRLNVENMIDDGNLSPQDDRPAKNGGGDLDPKEWSAMLLLPLACKFSFENILGGQWVDHAEEWQQYAECLFHFFCLTAPVQHTPHPEIYNQSKSRMNLYTPANYEFPAALFLLDVFIYGLSFPNGLEEAARAFSVLDIGDNTMRDPKQIYWTFARLYLHVEQLSHCIATHVCKKAKWANKPTVKWLVRMNLMRDLMCLIQYAGFTPQFSETNALLRSKYYQFETLLTQDENESKSADDRADISNYFKALGDACKLKRRIGFYKQEHMLSHRAGFEWSKALDLFLFFFRAFVTEYLLTDGDSNVFAETLVEPSETEKVARLGNKRMMLDFRDTSGRTHQLQHFAEMGLASRDHYSSMAMVAMHIWSRCYHRFNGPDFNHREFATRERNFDFNFYHPPETDGEQMAAVNEVALASTDDAIDDASDLGDAEEGSSSDVELASLRKADEGADIDGKSSSSGLEIEEAKTDEEDLKDAVFGNSSLCPSESNSINQKLSCHPELTLEEEDNSQMSNVNASRGDCLIDFRAQVGTKGGTRTVDDVSSISSFSVPTSACDGDDASREASWFQEQMFEPPFEDSNRSDVGVAYGAAQDLELSRQDKMLLDATNVYHEVEGLRDHILRSDRGVWNHLRGCIVGSELEKIIGSKFGRILRDLKPWILDDKQTGRRNVGEKLLVLRHPDNSSDSSRFSGIGSDDESEISERYPPVESINNEVDATRLNMLVQAVAIVLPDDRKLSAAESLVQLSNRLPSKRKIIHSDDSDFSIDCKKQGKKRRRRIDDDSSDDNCISLCDDDFSM